MERGTSISVSLVPDCIDSAGASLRLGWRSALGKANGIAAFIVVEECGLLVAAENILTVLFDQA